MISARGEVPTHQVILDKFDASDGGVSFQFTRTAPMRRNRDVEKARVGFKAASQCVVPGGDVTMNSGSPV